MFTLKNFFPFIVILGLLPGWLKAQQTAPLDQVILQNNGYLKSKPEGDNPEKKLSNVILNGTDNIIDVFPLSPCIEGEYYLGVQLYYDLGDHQDNGDWTCAPEIELLKDGSSIWTHTLTIESDPQTFITSVFHTAPISCQDGEYTIRVNDKGITGNVPESNVMIKVELYSTSEPIIDPSASINLSYEHIADNKQVLVTWTSPDGSWEYDLEWVYVDEYDPFSGTSTAAFAYKEPVRITTAAAYFKLKSVYPKGKLYFRVRAVGLHPENQEHRILGNWQYGASPFVINNYQPGMNWQAVTTFAEKGKNKKVISYFDGGLRNRQTLTNLSSEGMTLVAETKYDYEGRASLNILPVPDNDSSLIYRNEFNKFTGVDNEVINATSGNRKKFHYDNAQLENSMLDNTTGAGKYYSPNNVLDISFRDFIPDSEGYPYTQTVFTQDGTGRVAKQSGVGATFKTDGEHITSYYYAGAAQSELYRLFGSNVGHAEHYKKNMVVDPNGQASISYLDQEGRVIATALAGEAPENLEALPSLTALPNDPLTINLADKNKILEEGTKITHKFLNTTAGTDFTFAYNLSSLAASLENGECQDCNFDLYIFLVNPDGTMVDLSGQPGNQGTEPGSYVLKGLNAASCASPVITDVNFTETLITVGDYTIIKELRLAEAVYKDIRVQIEANTLTEQVEIKNSFVVDESDCDLCFSCEDEEEIETIINETFQEVSQQDCENILQQIITDIQETNGAEGYEPTQIEIENHAMYCKYTYCTTNVDSDVFDKKLYRISSWSTAGVLQNAFNEDPFFNDPNLNGNCVEALDAMSDALDNMEIATIEAEDNSQHTFFGPIAEVVDPANTAMWVGEDGKPNPVDGFHILYKGIAEENQDKERWTLYRNFYLEAKRKVKLEQHCNVSCQALVDELSVQDGFPTAPDQIDNWIQQRPEKELLSGSSEVQRETLVDLLQANCGVSFSEADKTTIKGHLESYFANAEDNFLGIIKSDDLVAGNTHLVSIDAILTDYSCSLGEISIDKLVCSEEPKVIGRALSNKVNPNYEKYEIEWDKSFGGNARESVGLFGSIPRVAKTSDGGMILGTDSDSDPSGNKTAPKYDGFWGDYWIFKIDANGEMEWDRSFGGSDFEQLRSIIETDDGGYLVIGSSNSPVSGNKTAPNQGNLVQDFWVIKIDEDGNKIWDKTYGGNGRDVPNTVIASGDGGYLLGGYSSSGISGNKTSQNYGSYDFWVVKIDEDGNQEWDKTYGGEGSDDLFSMIETPDGGYLLGGSSFSPISGSKTSSLFGEYDFWIVKIDEDGNQEWDNTFGGSDNEEMHSIAYAHDGGYILGGYSTSDISGNKTTNSLGIRDCWVVKIDENGNLEWDKSYGGSDYEEVKDIIPTVEGGYLLGNTSGSSQISNYYGNEDYWLVEIDNNGNKIWDKAFGGGGSDKFGGFINFGNQELYLYGQSSTSIDGNKTADNFGGYDAWLVKLLPTNESKNFKVFSSEPYITCQPLDAGEGFTNYVWEDMDGNVLANSQVFTPVTAGMYKVSAINECGDPTSTYAIYTESYELQSTFEVNLEDERAQCVARLEKTKDFLEKAAIKKFLDRKVTAYIEEFTEKCLANTTEQLTYTYVPKEYHYTLYYYDQAGSLVQTIPPEGVAPLSAEVVTKFENGTATLGDEPGHVLKTRYQYNSLNQLVWQSSPDGGISQFWYDAKGQLRLSQNAKQAVVDKYSYTRYDEHGRIQEVGQLASTQTITELKAKIQNPLFPEIDNYELEEITHTHYDEANPDLDIEGFNPNYLRGRVAWVEVKETESDQGAISLYDYDEHGNVKTLIQVLPGLEAKRTDYIYDLVSGNVNYVMYEYGKSDQFLHRYEYDSDNRIISVATSTDAFVWNTDAKYYYYAHGPLARIELGEHNVQGLDYYYTLQGWIKGVNAGGTTAENDPGQDGYANSTLNKYISRDEFAYALGYFNGDFNPIGNAVNLGATDAGSNLWTRFAETRPTEVTYLSGLYNGNIAHMVTDIKEIGRKKGDASKSIQGMLYSYDQLNRITKGRSLSGYSDGTGWAGRNEAASLAYDVDYSYDANGNLLTLQRFNEHSVLTDDLSYQYSRDANGRLIHNRLGEVTNASPDKIYTPDTQESIMYSNNPIPEQDLNYNHIFVQNNAAIEKGKKNVIKAKQSITFNPDFHAKPGSSFHASIGEVRTEYGIDNQDYVYDEIGNLIANASEDIVNIDWTVYGKVAKVEKTDGSYVSYRYDGAGNRILKQLVKNGETVSTHYVRDASGNMMAVYTNTELKEQPIYGSSRLGKHNNSSRKGERTLGNRQYELSNHLGNVLAVITDNKYGVDENSDNQIDYYEAKTISATDYFPFGMAMIGRSFQDSLYRHGFNGKENDTDFGNKQLVQDYGFRIYNPSIGKFLSVDPLTSSYPWYTPYQFAGNKPIAAIDLDGLEEKYVFDSWFWAKEFMKMVNEGELNYTIVEKAKQVHKSPYWRQQDFDYAQRVFGTTTNQVATYIPNKDPNRNGESEIWGRYYDEENGSYLLIKIASSGGHSSNQGFDFYQWQERQLEKDNIKMGYDPSTRLEGNDDGFSSMPWTNPDGSMGRGQKWVWRTAAVEGALVSIYITGAGLIGASSISISKATIATGSIALDVNTIVTNLFEVEFYEYLQTTSHFSVIENATNIDNPAAMFNLIMDLTGIYNNYKEKQIKENNSQNDPNSGKN